MENHYKQNRRDKLCRFMFLLRNILPVLLITLVWKRILARFTPHSTYLMSVDFQEVGFAPQLLYCCYSMTWLIQAFSTTDSKLPVQPGEVSPRTCSSVVWPVRTTCDTCSFSSWLCPEQVCWLFHTLGMSGHGFTEPETRDWIVPGCDHFVTRSSAFL